MPPIQSANQIPFKRIALIVIPAIIVVLVLNWMSTHAFIEINIQSSKDEGIAYKFLDKAGKETSFVNGSKKIRRLVNKDDYEVLIKQGETSHFSAIKTGGFLSTTKVDAKLLEEKGRRFVGNSPRPCMHFLGDTLLSYNCADELSTLQVHKPAGPDTPTVTQSSPNPSPDLIEGLINTKEGNILLYRTVEVAGHEEYEAEHKPHVAYLFQDKADFNPVNQRPITGLAEDELYAIAPLRDGFAAYGNKLTSILYYASLSAKPDKFDLIRPQDQDLVPYALSLRGDAIATAYTERGAERGEEANNPGTANSVKSEVVVQQGSTTKHFAFSKKYPKMGLCGQGKLCMLSADKTVEIYDISGDKAVHSFSIRSVEDIVTAGDKLIVAQADHILNIDPNNRQGYIQYSLGGYELCGLQSVKDNYVLCLNTPANNRVALYIDPNQPSDDIDKKVAELMRVEEIKGVNIYGNYINISPDPGPPVRDPVTGRGGYNQEHLATVKQKVREAIANSGIDQNKYHFSSTIPL